GDQANANLQRDYGTAWASKDDLKAYQDRVAEAERRDHRKIGAELDLFSFPEELGSGLPVLHPKCGGIKREMKHYVRARQSDEAERRDHRKIGAELDLFSFPEELGSGLPVFHPKGGVIKREMEDYVGARHIEEGFDYVGTPHISKESLYYTSGHLPYYGENM